MRIWQTIQSLKSLTIEQMLQLAFRLTLALIGAALLFVAAVYYGLINP